jgi:hypothetical protein
MPDQISESAFLSSPGDLPTSNSDVVVQASQSESSSVALSTSASLPSVSQSAWKPDPLSPSLSAAVAASTAPPSAKPTVLEASQPFTDSGILAPITPTDNSGQTGGTLVVGLSVGLILLVLGLLAVAGAYFAFIAKRRQSTAAYSVEVEAAPAVLTTTQSMESDFEAISETGLAETAIGDEGFEETKFPEF